MSELPDVRRFKKVIAFLIEEKSKGNKFINNSIAGLRYFYHWPNPHRLNCLVGLTSCAISPDGKIFICDSFPYYQRYSVPIGASFKRSFNSLFFPHPCEACWNSIKLELNLIRSFNPEVLLGVWRRFGDSL